VDVSQGYPFRLDDDELAEAITAMMAETGPVREDVQFSDLGLEPQLAIIQAGLLEQSRRQAERAERQARWIAYLSLALAVAVVALALIFGLLEYYDEQAWQDEELRILSEIRELLRR
jgi:hypothetical protein